MESQYQKIINDFEKKINFLLLKYDSLVEENKKMRGELSRKKEELMLSHHEILELRSNYERLKIAKTMAFLEEDKKNADKRIGKLVREIDTCLELLNE